LRIARGLFTALSDPAGVIAHRPGVLERVQLLASSLAGKVAIAGNRIAVL
jgi:hypothetical protein